MQCSTVYFELQRLNSSVTGLAVSSRKAFEQSVELISRHTGWSCWGVGGGGGEGWRKSEQLFLTMQTNGLGR